LRRLKIERKNLGMEASLCRECGGNTVSSQGEIVCSSCGLVVTEISVLSIHHPFDQIHYYASPTIREQNEMGSQPNFVGGLGGYIGFNRGFFFRDRKGTPLPAEKQRLFAHLKAAYDQQNRFRGYETTYRCFCSLNRVAEMLRLPKTVRRRAAYLFRKAIASQKKPKGITSLMLMGYCILYATREFDRTVPSRTQEIAEAFQKLGHRVSAKAISRVGSEYSHLFTPEQQLIRSEDYLGRNLERVTSNKKVLKKMSLLSIDRFRYQRNMLHICNDLLRRINGAERGGRNPYIFSASTIYTGERYFAEQTRRKPLLTQKLTAEIIGVAEYSIREHFCSVLKKHIQLLPDYEEITPEHSPVSDPPAADSNLHLNPTRIS
jgi:transcription initiation factor TFIIIB Brf1 subunit/transcription initiation factor TFIIB